MTPNTQAYAACPNRVDAADLDDSRCCEVVQDRLVNLVLPGNKIWPTLLLSEKKLPFSKHNVTTCSHKKNSRKIMQNLKACH